MQKMKLSESAATEAERLRATAEVTHVAALNLAVTYGVFHGINSARTLPVRSPQIAAAINSIQNDLLHLMAVRVCALCEHGPRPDDASLLALERKITPAIKAHLIAADQRWRATVGLRATKVTDVGKGIAGLRRQRTTLRTHAPALKRAKHFRDKLLAHVTAGHDPNNQVILRDLWKLTRIALSAARSLRLALQRHDWDYLAEARRAESTGRALVKAVIAKAEVTGSPRKRRIGAVVRAP